MCRPTTRTCGLPTTPCKSSGIYSEDDKDELHLRSLSIGAQIGVPLDALSDMAWRTAVDDDAELVEFDETENIFTHPRVRRTEDYITGRFG